MIALSVTPSPQDYDDLLAQHKKFYAVDADEFIVTPMAGDRLEFHASGGRSFSRVVTHVEELYLDDPDDTGSALRVYALSLRPLGRAEQ